MKNKITRLPKYYPGQVIDLGFEYGKRLPTRILIKQVFMDDNNPHSWMYMVTSEATDKNVAMSENIITSTISKKSAPCYKNSNIIKRYKDGFRFAGNYPDLYTEHKADLISKEDNVAEVRIYRALYPDGKVQQGYHGLWVKYMNVINDDGMVIDEHDNTLIGVFRNPNLLTDKEEPIK